MGKIIKFRPRVRAAKRAPKRAAAGRRRLMPSAAIAAGGALIAKKVYNTIKTRQARAARMYANRAKSNYINRLQASDNIVNLPAFKIGKSKKLTFTEKVQHITNPPVIHKRQYSFSAESSPGRKAWFGIPINKLTNTGSGTTGDLYDDIINNWQRLTSDQNSVDPTFNNGTQYNGAYYVDYLSERIRMVNSSTNSCKGKLTLYGYKRDCEATFTNVNVPMTPINLMMQGSVGNLVAYGPQQEQTAGNGWNFNTTSPGVDYDANYDMPGSVLNSGGATAQTDPSLKVLSQHISHFTGYYFKQLGQVSFSLKPGQQVEHWTIMNDLPCIQRASQDMTYLRGVSFYLVVEFEAGIVGDSTLANVVSLGTTQLSVIVEEKRIISHKGRKGLKVVMPTAPLADILQTNQFIINPDTGAGDIGAETDA